MPLQFLAASTFQGVGNAIGQAQGEVDLMEGRVRVELDAWLQASGVFYGSRFC